MKPSDSALTGYELHFQPLADPRQACAFPCDACGHVDMDGLSDVALRHYLYARAVIGRVYGFPAVRCRARR